MNHAIKPTAWSSHKIKLEMKNNKAIKANHEVFEKFQRKTFLNKLWAEKTKLGSIFNWIGLSHNNDKLKSVCQSSTVTDVYMDTQVSAYAIQSFYWSVHWKKCLYPSLTSPESLQLLWPPPVF